MPSQFHESLLQLFRNRPALAAELLRDTLHMQLPAYTEVRIGSADFADIQPAEYRADLVVLLLKGKPVLGIVLEVQLSSDEDKRYVWPAYVVNLRARIRCPVCLLVVAADEAVARWARKPIELGGGHSRLVPWVLGLSGVPEITDEYQAMEEPELAVLSAIGHARDPDTAKSTRIALLAHLAAAGLDASRSVLYSDLILHSLPEAAQRALKAMNLRNYEFQSDFARKYVGQGRIEMVLELLTTRYGALSDAIVARVGSLDKAGLYEVANRLLTAETVGEALGMVEV